MVHPRAGQPAQPSDLIDVPHVVGAYYTRHPDPHDPAQHVAFGTSGHRGAATAVSFNEDHIAATTQAIVEHRRSEGIGGPLFLARDTHALSEPAWITALEVLIANDIDVRVDSRDRYTPTPALSHAVIAAGQQGSPADGIVVTPSHNPPSDGGFKYNPPHGGPADSRATAAIAAAANRHIADGLRSVRRVTARQALERAGRFDFLEAYVADLPQVVDLAAIREAGVRIGADPMGGAAVDYWGAVAERHGLDITVVNQLVDPTWRFMTLDVDGKIRMDCSSPAAMASLVAAAGRFDVAVGNDADADRHGIVTPDGGLMNPNHFLAVAVDFLFGGARPQWSPRAAVGKTLVSSSMIDRVAAAHGRTVWEVPVGFKWFVPGLSDGSVAFGGEESAGASFLRRDGGVWTTDKDGILLGLLAAEVLARTGESPSRRYDALTAQYGAPAYARVDAPADRRQKEALAALSPQDVTTQTLAGHPVRAALTRAPGNDAPLGGLKVVTDVAWFAARPSGTEDVYKVYAESFEGPEHLAVVQAEAQQVVASALGG